METVTLRHDDYYRRIKKYINEIWSPFFIVTNNHKSDIGKPIAICIVIFIIVTFTKKPANPYNHGQK